MSTTSAFSRIETNVSIVTGLDRLRWSQARACSRLASTCMNPGSRSITARRRRLWGRGGVLPEGGWSLRSANIYRALYRRGRTEGRVIDPLSHDIYLEIAASQVRVRAPRGVLYPPSRGARLAPPLTTMPSPT